MYHEFIANFQPIFESAKRKEGREAVMAILNEAKAQKK